MPGAPANSDPIRSVAAIQASDMSNLSPTASPAPRHRATRSRGTAVGDAGCPAGAHIEAAGGAFASGLGRIYGSAA
jgi:hypothetical protein